MVKLQPFQRIWGINNIISGLNGERNARQSALNGNVTGQVTADRHRAIADNMGSPDRHTGCRVTLPPIANMPTRDEIGPATPE